MLATYLNDYDFNLPLMDALDNSGLSVMCRLLAGASMDTKLSDGYYSAMEVLEAFRCLEADKDARVDPEDSLGSAMIEHLLAGEGDDYQRRLYYLVSEAPVSEAVSDLKWLTDVLAARVKMLKVFDQHRIPLVNLPGRYVETDDIGCVPFGYD